MITREHNDRFKNFRGSLERYKREINLSRSDSRIERTLRWLISIQKDNGSWGNNDVASTALTLLALHSFSLPINAWELGPQVRAALERGAAFLVTAFESNSWENEVWDTAIATRALIAVDAGKYSHFLRSRSIWLTAETETFGNYGPHHLAQALITLVALGSHKDVLIKKATLLETSLGATVSYQSPYVLAQCVEALCLVKPDAQLLSAMVNRLKDYIAAARLDNANFLNICLALQGLWIAPGKGNVEVARLGVASLFGDTCFRTSGGWYNSELMTAWALLTLSRFSQEIVLRIPYSELIYDIENFRLASEALLLRGVRNYVIVLASNVLVGALWGSLLAFFVTFTTMKEGLYEWAKWLIWSGVTILVSFNLAQCLRPYDLMSPLRRSIFKQTGGGNGNRD